MLNFGNKEFRNLQEQVLENAKNIEILKERPSLKVVVVNELPPTGEEGILYLVPKNPDPDTSDADSYDEYIWLPEKQTYEFVGSTAIDLSNMVTTDTEQTITGAKTFNAIANFNAGLKASTVEIDSEITMKATSDSGINIWKLRPLNDYNLCITINDSDRFLFQANMFAPATYQNTSINLGSFNYKWDKVYANQLNLGTETNSLYIAKDDSDRIGIYHNNIERIKIGGETSTYCAANWTPDYDNKYLLGTGALRWKSLNVNSVINANGNLTLRGNPDVTVMLGNKDNAGAMIPSGNNKSNLGSTSRLWKAVYTTTIGDATKSVNVADIVTKPNYANPNVFASGTLDANGEGTIDISAQGVGMPEDGLYMFTYANAQCFIALTSTMIQNATSYPMRCPCPVLKESGGVITVDTGNLKISRASDILTIKVASTVSGSATSTNGWGWRLTKVM